jgi:hypothetical protein
MFSFVRRPGFELGWSLLQIKDGDFTNHPDAMSAFDAFFANNVDYSLTLLVVQKTLNVYITLSFKSFLS